MTSHIFWNMYVMVLKFHICIANEKLADPHSFCFLLILYSVKLVVPELCPFIMHCKPMGHNEILCQKLSKTI